MHLLILHWFKLLWLYLATGEAEKCIPLAHLCVVCIQSLLKCIVHA